MKIKNTESHKLFNDAKKLMPGGVNSPVRSFKAVGGTPHFISRGDGPFIFDEDNNKFIDFTCSWGPLILGHNNNLVKMHNGSFRVWNFLLEPRLVEKIY